MAYYTNMDTAHRQRLKRHRIKHMYIWQFLTIIFTFYLNFTVVISFCYSSWCYTAYNMQLYVKRWFMTILWLIYIFKIPYPTTDCKTLRFAENLVLSLWTSHAKIVSVWSETSFLSLLNHSNFTSHGSRSPRMIRPLQPPVDAIIYTGS